VDCQDIERLFSSGVASDLLSVYERADLESLIRWMRNRPTAQIKIREVEGDSEVVVVIPTADSEGSFAKRAASLYKGLHVVLVESRGQFFNYARSVNAGLRRAVELSPRWVVVSNDDLLRADPTQVLLQELSTSTRSLIMASPSSYHTYRVSLVEPSMTFLKGMRIVGKLLSLAPAEVYGELVPRFKDKFHVRFMVAVDSMMGPMKRFAGKVADSLWNAGSFMVLSRRVITQNTLDETFINGYEDVLLSMRFRDDKEIIRYSLEEMKGGSLGFGRMRFLRNFVNEIYLNYLLTETRSET
jgi:hypothetical protein